MYGGGLNAISAMGSPMAGQVGTRKRRRILDHLSYPPTYLPLLILLITVPLFFSPIVSYLHTPSTSHALNLYII